MMQKIVSTSGRVTLGKKYAGCRFEVEELASGEMVLHPRVARCGHNVHPTSPKASP
jgi:hypothetical protein